MLKILHIITRLEKGGSSKNVISTIKGLKDYDNYLIYGKSENQEDTSLLESKRIFEINFLTREISPFRDFLAFLKIYSLISQIEPDIVHTHTSKAGVLGRLAAWLYKKRKKKDIIIVHTPHGHLLYGYFGKFKTALFLYIERLISQITDYFIALTPQEKEESIKAKIGKKEKWEIIHSGIDFPLTKPDKKLAREKLKISEKEFLIGTAARFEKVKGMEIFVKAIDFFEKKYKPENTKYIMVGDGSLRKKIENLIQNSGLKEKFILTGFKENIFDYLVAMDIFVQPSLNEAMGRTVIEAQFCGVPVIVSNACGLISVIKENETGLVFEKGNWRELAEKINILYSNQDLLKNFSINAIKFVNQKDESGYLIFSSDNMIYKLSKFYDKIVRK